MSCHFNITSYSLRPIKSTILILFRQISRGVKKSHALIYWPHAVSFGMQIKSDHLIRQVVEIQFLELHSLWIFFSNARIAVFLERRSKSKTIPSSSALASLVFLISTAIWSLPKFFFILQMHNNITLYFKMA
jgi:hypothetical protein